jgi:selenoprotein W-related protein
VRAVSLAALLKKHCDNEVELIPSTGGVFEVVVDGVLVYSKKKTGEFPDEQQLVKQQVNS